MQKTGSENGGVGGPGEGRHRELHKRPRLLEEERATGTLNGNVMSSPLIGPDEVQLVGTLVIMFKPKASGGRDLGP